MLYYDLKHIIMFLVILDKLNHFKLEAFLIQKELLNDVKIFIYFLFKLIWYLMFAYRLINFDYQ